MTRGNMQIKNPERFKGDYNISEEKLNSAIEKACNKLLSNLDMYKQGFPKNMVYGNGLKYEFDENKNWECGLYTGTFLLAYELSGNEEFLNLVKEHIPTYEERFDKKIGFNDHDYGFAFSPSVISYHKLTGDKASRELALRAAEYFYEVGYSKKGGFIPRLLFCNDDFGCRTMMDTMFNIPFYFWAWEETGNKDYFNAGHSQAKITRDYLIREDGSSYHHYRFDPETHKPVAGITFQGNRDESTWTRGHAWGVYGFPIAYDYTKDESLMEVHKDVVAFMLNNLPKDNVLYWDYDFTDGSGEPRDTSANIISACGLLEAIKFMDDDAPEKEIYKNAAMIMIEAVIDGYTGDIGEDYDGLLWGATGARKFDLCIDGCAPYADYFYLEALLRLKKPGWKRYW